MQHFIDRIQMGDDSVAMAALARDLAQKLADYALCAPE